MKVSFIATVFNEEKTINDFMESIFQQSIMPDEIIIVDGGSTDATASVISNFKFKISNKRINFKFIVKKGNRAVGRNEAIKKATNEIIACSDAGCILDKDWLKNLIRPFSNPKIDVVAGYYKGIPKSIFEKCLIPYILVMPDRVNENNFLPASRSMSFKKTIWKKVGGFPEEFSNNEDYIFAKRLKKIKANIIFKKDAVVSWIPRNNIKDTFTMFYRFAKGDSESHIFRPKVVLIFLRYAVGIMLLFSFLISKSNLMFNTLYSLLFLYVLWSIVKNYRYVRNWKAIFYLPLIQVISDVAVIIGTVIGIMKLTRSEISLFFNGYLSLVLFCLIVSSLFNLSHIVFLFLFFLPFIFFIYKFSSFRILSEIIICLGLIVGVIFFTFRFFRSLFYPPIIDNNLNVGYAQFYGYPLNFDTILFFIFITIPVLAIFYILLRKLNKA